MFLKVGVSKDAVDVVMNIYSFHSVDPERIDACTIQTRAAIGLGPYVYCVCGSPFHIFLVQTCVARYSFMFTFLMLLRTCASRLDPLFWTWP